MMNQLYIRDYCPDDFGALCALFLRAVRETASRDYSPEQVAAWAQIDESLWRKKFSCSDVSVAIYQGDVAGFIAVQNDYIDLLYVSPDCARRGIATALLSHLQRQHPQTRFWVEASITARPFFQQQGYWEVKAQQVEVRGRVFTNYVMHKAST